MNSPTVRAVTAGKRMVRLGRWLASRAVGSVLLTYHGLGGPIPGSYERVHVEPAGTAWLCAWRKGSDRAVDAYWLDDGSDARLMSIEALVRHLLPDPDEPA